MSDRVADYDYVLPEELVADRPAPERDGARMMVLDRASGAITHAAFRDFPGFLREGDEVVLNNSRVIKARLLSPDGRIEVFLLEALGRNRWVCLTKPGRKTRLGAEVVVAGTVARVVGIQPGGERVVEFREDPDLEKSGLLPVPPYFKRAPDAADDSRYQTVYASVSGSVAAPTAGLHFTPEILRQLPHSFLTLHVGVGTFRPVKTDRVQDHVLHEEHYEIPAECALRVNGARRVVAVGTTVARVLESRREELLTACSGRTDIFIRPPYAFRRVGAMLTNFHLPRSTLLMLVSAFAGREFVLGAYAEAIRLRYRFYSYGDCMLIV